MKHASCLMQFLLSWLETKSRSMGAIHMMSLQFTVTAWPPLSQPIWNKQKDQFFPKMVKKCLGSIHGPEKRSLLYLSMLLRQELFTRNKNTRNGGGRKISNSPVGWRLAGWSLNRTKVTVLWKLHADSLRYRVQQSSFAPWIKEASDLTDIKCLPFFYASPKADKFLATLFRKHAHHLVDPEATPIIHKV